MALDAVTYRAYARGDEKRLVALYNRIFAAPRTEARWRWEYLDNPVGRVDVSVALDGAAVVGSAGGVAVALADGGRPLRATRTQDGFVHPHYRRRGIYTETLAAFDRLLLDRSLDFAWGWPSDNSLPALLKNGYRHLFDVHSWQLSGRLAAAATATAARIEVETVPAFSARDAEFLGRRAAAAGSIHNPRGRDYLSWRYHADSGRSYRVLRAFDGERLAGLAVFKLYAAESSVDVLELAFDDDDELLRAALSAIVGCFAGVRVQSVSLWSMEHYPLHARLRALGFTREQRLQHFIAKVFSDRGPADWREPASYYLTMGDRDVY